MRKNQLCLVQPSTVLQWEFYTAFIRAMCHAIFDWAELDETRIEPLRIHGRHDRVIPHAEGVQQHLDGGHLMVMTHAQECVDFIRGNWFSDDPARS